ncbi:MAG: hypothetical protein FWD87_06250 [Spirochaetaceae bacterium]|nr:hypothetical protein [Spirochaetaceae bacterium]
MKKIILCFTLYFLLLGTVWAQLGTKPVTPDLITPPRNLLGGLFDSFYATSTMSTEARYSAGIFTSDIDNYIDATFFDPSIRNFFFMSTDPGSIGFARTFDCLYLAIYYHGSMLNAGGDRLTIGNDTISSSNLLWENNLAFLVASPVFGAFRLDFKFNTETIKENDSGLETVNRFRQNAPLISITRGGVYLGNLEPYITVGYQFANRHILGRPDTFPGNDDYIEATYTWGSRLGIQTGVNYNFNDNSRIWGDISFIKAFADSFSGDEKIIAGANANRFDGSWGIGFRAAYSQIFDFGKLSAGFSPNFTVAYMTASFIESHNAFSTDLFGVSAGLDAGLRYHNCEKLTFYTGASLHLIDWLLLSNSDYTSWALAGFEWGNKWDLSGSAEANSLGLGMTLSPFNNLVIGAGLNAFLDRFFFFSLKSLVFESGDFFEKQRNQPGAWIDNVFSGVRFDITVSYRF